jgi:2-polyprenyl-3-methyl-5-hydroxy-6-metoxy-1,4-benzoquinol methylase
MDSRIAANRRLWNEWARINQDSALYDMAGFRAGQTSLKHIELEEVGEVTGKSLLHLQCHFGQDTLSWAQLGAEVTGVDLSPEAIRRAQTLAKELGVDACFVCANVLDPKELGDAQFDIVFTSYGVLNWLPDLGAWARVIARHLKPGGRFYIVEFHPIISMLDDDAKEITTGYFNGGEALRFESTASYAGGEHAPIESFEWPHSLAEIVQSLLDAGLTLEALHEFPYCVHNCWNFLVESEPGRYVAKHHPGKLPLLFSISTRK